MGKTCFAYAVLELVSMLVLRPDYTPTNHMISGYAVIANRFYHHSPARVVPHDFDPVACGGSRVNEG